MTLFYVCMFLCTCFLEFLIFNFYNIRTLVYLVFSILYVCIHEPFVYLQVLFTPTANRIVSMREWEDATVLYVLWFSLQPPTFPDANFGFAQSPY